MEKKKKSVARKFLRNTPDEMLAIKALKQEHHVVKEPGKDRMCEEHKESKQKLQRREEMKSTRWD